MYVKDTIIEYVIKTTILIIDTELFEDIIKSRVKTRNRIRIQFYFLE